MIISHKHKFIFIKTRKTAGTSIEIALRQICGDDDIITPISKEDEEERRKLRIRGPQNFLIPKRLYNYKDWLRLIIKKKKAFFYNHMPARKIKAYVGNQVWNEYYKFCFVRNPIDRIVSLYYWRTRENPGEISISKWLDEYLTTIKGPELYLIQDKIAVDQMFKYENLEDSLKAISNQIGLTPALRLLDYKAKSDYRPQVRIEDILSADDIKLIQEKFAYEFMEFGY